jgi:hypothetical protein
MSELKRRDRSLCFDSLERRECPSPVAGLTSHVRPAADGNVVRPFIANGTATLAQITGQPNGDGLFTLSVQGETNLAGHFGGRFQFKMSNRGPTDVDVVLYTSVGEAHLTMTLGGNSSMDKSVHGAFSIAGGTGLFIHASGAGKVDVLPNNELQAIPFELSGQIIY